MYLREAVPFGKFHSVFADMFFEWFRRWNQVDKGEGRSKA